MRDEGTGRWVQVNGPTTTQRQRARSLLRASLPAEMDLLLAKDTFRELLLPELDLEAQRRVTRPLPRQIPVTLTRDAVCDLFDDVLRSCTYLRAARMLAQLEDTIFDDNIRTRVMSLDRLSGKGARAGSSPNR